jgi:hypothetical protein
MSRFHAGRSTRDAFLSRQESAIGVYRSVSRGYPRFKVAHTRDGIFLSGFDQFDWGRTYYLSHKSVNSLTVAGLHPFGIEAANLALCGEGAGANSNIGHSGFLQLARRFKNCH